MASSWNWAADRYNEWLAVNRVPLSVTVLAVSTSASALASVSHLTNAWLKLIGPERGFLLRCSCGVTVRNISCVFALVTWPICVRTVRNSASVVEGEIRQIFIQRAETSFGCGAGGGGGAAEAVARPVRVCGELELALAAVLGR